MAADEILITGADGYLGSRLAERLLAETDARLLLWVRAEGAAELREKQARLAALAGPNARRVEIRGGDLAAEDPFAGIDARGVRGIVHTAAVIRFNVEREIAERVNLGGARKMFAFAERCPALESFVLVSSIYASGLRAGPIEERRLDASAGFSNHYEWSKWASEELAHTEFAGLPWRIARVATVIADDESGAVSQQNSFHNTLKLLYFGLLSILPGDPRVRPYFVTGEFAAGALSEILSGSPARSIFHVAHARSESVTLGDLIDTAFEVFESDDSFRARRLVQGIGDAGGAIVRQALASVAPFAKQLFLDKDVRNERLAGTLRAYRAPDPRDLVRNTCRRLVETRWGKGRGRAAS
jgi:nucleoside-diphosphate-sugar epimerase